MKTQDFWARAITHVTVAGLVCVLALFAALGSIGKHRPQSGAKLSPIIASAATQPAKPQKNPQWIEAYGKLPLSFEKNVGQTAREVRYVSHGSGYELFLTPQEADLALRGPVRLDLSPQNRFATLRALREARRAHQATMTAFVRMRLEGANPEPQIVGSDRLPGKVNYFIGNNPKKWHTDVPSYARVKYVGVYPGVDVVFYGNQRRLEYDFVVAPGADPNVIALKVDGARKMRINKHGDLVLSVPGGEVELQKPLIYQQVKGERQEIRGKYTLAGDHRITFSITKYDRNEPLVLDPVLNYSTYLGGTADDDGSAIAVDASGDAFVAGTTLSTDFPTPSAVKGYQKGPLASNAGGAAFVTEIDPTGTTLLYSTYIAGSAPGESAFGIAVDSSGKIYVTGQTFSADFPTNSTVPGFKQSTASNVNGTSYITKLDPAQTGIASLLYSSYLGGTTGTIGDVGNGVAVADASGVVYVTGFTDSSAGTGPANFPVVNGFQTALSNASGNAFLAKIDTTTSAAPVFSTYLGGNGANSAALGFGDAAFGLTADSSGNAYIVGTTSSTDFATFSTVNLTLKGFDLTYPTGNTSNTAFVSRIDTTKTGGASLAYLTYLGGTGPDFGDAIALGPAPNHLTYVTGQTNSASFPLFPVAVPPAGPFQTTKGAGGVAYVSLIDTTTNANPSYSTFLGGTGGDEALGIRVDGQGNAYVGGKTQSVDFPHSLGAFQPALATGASGNGFISEVTPGGNGAADLVYSTYFGGSGDGNVLDIDQVEGIALDSSNNAYVTGHTFSKTNFPVFPPATATPPAFQTSLNGTAGDAFVAKLTPIPRVVVTPSPFNFGIQPVGVTSTPQIFTLTNNTNATVTFTSIATAGVSPAANTDFAKASDNCSPSGVAAGAQCMVSVTFKPGAAGSRTSTLTFTDSDSSSPQVVNLSGTGSAAATPAVGLAPTSLTFSGQLLTTTSAAQTVTLTNTGNAPLTINSIAASGDFAETNTCPHDQRHVHTNGDGFANRNAYDHR